MDPITLLIYVLVGVLVVVLIQYLLGMVDLPSNIKTIILIVVILIIVIWLLRTAGLF